MGLQVRLQACAPRIVTCQCCCWHRAEQYLQNQCTQKQWYQAFIITAGVPQECSCQPVLLLAQRTTVPAQDQCTQKQNDIRDKS
jgi:hypothetical protein